LKQIAGNDKNDILGIQGTKCCLRIAWQSLRRPFVPAATKKEILKEFLAKAGVNRGDDAL
jgi:hypothetical protein